MRTHLVLRCDPGEARSWLVDPARTTRVWFDASTGALEPGAEVRWTWTAHDAHADVVVLTADHDRVAYRWGSAAEPSSMTRVTWTFAAHEHGTRVEVVEEGLPDDDPARLVDTTVGHTKVLCALKAMVEHDVDLRLVEDQ